MGKIMIYKKNDRHALQTNFVFIPLMFKFEKQIGLSFDKQCTETSSTQIGNVFHLENTNETYQYFINCRELQLSKTQSDGGCSCVHATSSIDPNNIMKYLEKYILRRNKKYTIRS